MGLIYSYSRSCKCCLDHFFCEAAACDKATQGELTLILSQRLCLFICICTAVSRCLHVCMCNEWVDMCRPTRVHVCSTVCVSNSRRLSISCVPLQRLPTCSLQPWEAFHCSVRLAWQAANSNTFSHANFYRSKNNEYITVIK